MRPLTPAVTGLVEVMVGVTGVVAEGVTVTLALAGALNVPAVFLSAAVIEIVPAEPAV